MKKTAITRATLGRLPIYLQYLQSVRTEKKSISATNIANALGLGEVQVRKDLNTISGAGRPKVGYDTEELIGHLKDYLGQTRVSQAVIVGAGKLGRALLDYDGFKEYGMEIAAAFDINIDRIEYSETEHQILPMSEFEDFCSRNNIRIGIITVPKASAQEVCDRMVKSNISAIWSFSHTRLVIPSNIVLKEEDLALSLAYLNKQMN